VSKGKKERKKDRETTLLHSNTIFSISEKKNSMDKKNFPNQKQICDNIKKL
jgi:hypothetical protein